MGKERDKKEVDNMLTLSTEYNEKVFLSELEESLKEMQTKRKSKNNQSSESCWRDLFNNDEE